MRKTGLPPTFRVPDGATFWLYVRINIALSVLFLIIYGGANALAAGSDHPARLYFTWELSIPFVPAAIVIYQSIALLFLLPVFAFDAAGLRRLARSFATATVVGGLVFTLFPARVGFERVPVDGPFAAAYTLLYQLDHPFNALPSLHIAYSTLILGALFKVFQSLGWKVLCIGWGLAIAVSVLLVHQHHLADIGSGALLGLCLLIGFQPSRGAQGTLPTVSATDSTPEPAPATCAHTATKN